MTTNNVNNMKYKGNRLIKCQSNLIIILEPFPIIAKIENALWRAVNCKMLLSFRI